jgi:hypothetical protein
MREGSQVVSSWDTLSAQEHGWGSCGERPFVLFLRCNVERWWLDTEEELTRQSYANAAALTFLQFSGLVLACYIVMIVLFFRRREYAAGLLCALLNLLCGGGQIVGVIIALILGWINARRWGLRTFLLFWTVLFLLALANGLLFVIWGAMDIEQWQRYFYWLPKM